MVLLLLALFLRPVLAFWVSVGVPVAFMGALYLTNYVGLSIDGISLFGFILVLGIMVDDAIVVGESVHSRQREGGTPLIGSIEGTQRITIPVIFGVLTTICTFLPMLQGVGSSGQIGAVIATVVICCLIFSLIESQLILPAHLGNKQTKTAKGEVYLLLVPLMVIVLLQFSWSTSSFVGLAIALMTVVYALDRLGLTDDPARRLIAAQSRFSASVEALIDGPFRRIVQRATQARYTTLAMAFAFFLSGVAVFGSGRLPFSFFPPLAADQVIAQLTMPLGTSSEITEQAVRHLERTGEAIREELNEQYAAGPPVTHILASVGGSQGGGLGPPGSGGGGASGGHMGEVTLQLTPSQSRTISTKEVAALVAGAFRIDCWRGGAEVQ